MLVQMENHITILKRSLIELFLIKIALVLILHEYKRAEKDFFVSISFERDFFVHIQSITISAVIEVISSAMVNGLWSFVTRREIFQE